MATIWASYESGSCDNCKKNISVNDKIPALIVHPLEELPNIYLFLCEECARKIDDYTTREYFKRVDKAKAENSL